MSKKSFWSRLFSGNTEGVDTEPKADANGAVTFSAEQFSALTTHLEGWETALETVETELKAVTDFKAQMTAFDGIVKKHGEQLAKLAITPAVTTTASTVEPQETESLEVDPLDAKLKAMMR